VRTLGLVETGTSHRQARLAVVCLLNYRFSASSPRCRSPSGSSSASHSFFVLVHRCSALASFSMQRTAKRRCRS